MAIVEIKLEQIKAKTQNYRLAASEQDVSGLMASIKKNGLLNPLTVKQQANGTYRLVAGFRRYNALKKLKYKTVWVNIVKNDMSDIAINLVENMQRENTTSFEVGRGVYNIMKQDNLTEAEAGVLLGLTSKAVKDYLTLYKELPAKFRDCVVSVKSGATRTAKAGFISNAIALRVLSAKKSGEISRAQTCSILQLCKQDKTITATNVKSIIKEVASGKKANSASNNVCSLTVKLNLTAHHKKKLGVNAHDKIRKLIEKEFKVKCI